MAIDSSNAGVATLLRHNHEDVVEDGASLDYLSEGVWTKEVKCNAKGYPMTTNYACRSAWFNPLQPRSTAMEAPRRSSNSLVDPPPSFPRSACCLQSVSGGSWDPMS